MTKPPLTISDSYAKPLPKRFYKIANTAARDGAFAVELDGRAAKTPLKRPLTIASKALADAAVAEWASQVDVINPNTMPLTRLIMTAIDSITGQEATVAADIVAFAGNDLLCYRAETPADLVARQAKHWDPVLAWAARDLKATFKTTAGLIHVAQPAAATAQVAKALDGIQALPIAALHVLTTLTGSALLALAIYRKHLTLAAAWTAAHVDEDWQIEKWGTDAEAETRRANRLRDAEAAALILAQG